MYHKEHAIDKVSSMVLATAYALGLSMVLRASLSLESGDKKSVYGTSVFFNYLAGVCALNAAYRLHDSTPMRRNLLVSTERHGKLAVLFLMAFVPLALLICGIALMFNPPNEMQRAVGANFLRALAVLVSLTSITIFVLFAGQYEMMRKHVSARKILMAISASLMVGLWSVFMCVRSYMSLSNPTRSSETVFLLLNFLPITLGSAAALLNSAEEDEEKS
ncbi:hypothetical protein EV178_004266 [Coemansia sp. RSA 1646]|nr:hypothetical protein EV178_004266 [Coemansia sp. RSA 1646]KAJ1770838.1 hypothetical protein LPJ74_002824 [Coemansia sp. RSA 1843]KAJ2211745.1 hypothetical protein EV179_005246 [Coemansia sp. RSA 487]